MDNRKYMLLAHGKNSSAKENVIIGSLGNKERQFIVKIAWERFLSCLTNKNLSKVNFLKSEMLKYNILDDSNVTILSVYIFIYICVFPLHRNLEI